MSVSTIFSHYLAGLALYKYNFLTSGFGLILSLLLSLLLIPVFNLEGAAITTSIVFTFQTVFQIIMFKKETDLSWNSMIGKFIHTSFDIKNTLLKRIWVMCGISGVISSSNLSAIQMSNELHQMNELIKHRGPDNEGIAVFSEAGNPIPNDSDQNARLWFWS